MFVVEDDKASVYPCVHKVNDVTEIIIKLGNAKTFVDKMVPDADRNLVNLVRTINMKSAHKRILPQPSAFH